jgi:hypothetical protein
VTRRLAAAAAIGCGVASPASAAAPTLTIGARPTSVVAFAGDVTIYGSLVGGKGAQLVTFEEKECGVAGSFHLAGGATTSAGGSFANSTPLAPGVTTKYRARWRDVLSNVVLVRVAPRLDLQSSGRRFSVAVSGRGYLRGKRIALQRFASGRWLTVRALTLRETFGNGGVVSANVRLPKHTLVRAVLPRSEARPCLLPAVSNAVRT